MTPHTDKLLTPKEAAARVDVSLKTIRRYIQKGALVPVRRGPGPKPRLLIRESALAHLFRN